MEPSRPVALERADDLARDPAPVEAAFLSFDLLAVERAFVHQTRVEGDGVADRLETRRRIVVRPGRAPDPAAVAADRVVVRRHSLPLAERRAAARPLERAGGDVLERHVVDGRMARLQNAVCPRRIGDDGAAEDDADALGGRLDARRAWIAPD